MTDVRIVRGDPSFIEQVQRTPAQKHADEALTKAAELADSALEDVKSALEWLEVVTNPINRDVPTYIKKLMAEIAETKRLRQ